MSKRRRFFTIPATPWPYTKHPERAMTRSAQRYLRLVEGLWAACGIAGLAVLLGLAGMLLFPANGTWAWALPVALLIWFLTGIVLVLAFMMSPQDDLIATERLS